MFKASQNFMARAPLWLDTLINSALSVVLVIMQRHAPAKTLPCQTCHIKTLIESHSQYTDYWSVGKVGVMFSEILVTVSHQDNIKWIVGITGTDQDQDRRETLEMHY